MINKNVFNASIFLVLICLFFPHQGQAQGCASGSLNLVSVNSLNQDLNDYAVIFEDASADRRICNSTAANALTTKIRNTLTTGPQSNFGSAVDAYQQWLNGASVSFIFAAALRLSNAGVLDFQLEQELMQVRDNFRNGVVNNSVQQMRGKDPSCGFDNNKWIGQNTCMDDYSVAASGFAWIAAYEAKKGRATDPYAGYARDAIAQALSTSESICVINPNDPNTLAGPIQGRGPCLPMDAARTNLINGSYQTLSLNHGTETIAYGLGLMTSVSSAVVGLKTAGITVTFSADEKLLATALFEEGQRKTQVDGSQFLQGNCWRFRFNADLTQYTTATDVTCDDRGGIDPRYTAGITQQTYDTAIRYAPTMFPLSQFYATYIFPGAPGPVHTTGFAFNVSPDSAAFLNNFGDPNGFFGSGRRVFYGQMEWDSIRRLDLEFLSTVLQEKEGFFENLDCNNLSGWAWEQTQPNTPITVDVYEIIGPANAVAPTLSGIAFNVQANQLRQDLIAAHKGNGAHGFNLPISFFQDGRQHVVEVTYGGTTVPLSGSPRVLSCSVPPPPEQGIQDATNCDRIDGFAQDTTQPNNPVDVNIYHPELSHFSRQLVNVLVATVSANLNSDLVPATAGKGAHGFLEYVPSYLKDGSVQTIHIEFAKDHQVLSNTDRALDTSACAVIPPPGPYEGWMDGASCTRVDGWAWDHNFPNSPIDVELLVDGAQYATLSANLFGPDLLQAGKGNGNHRLAWYIPASLKDGQNHTISLRARGDVNTFPLSSASATNVISCSAPPPQPPPQAASYNTPAGTGITVLSPAAAGQPSSIEVTFDSVQSSGNTTFVPVDPAWAGAMPYGYSWPQASLQPLMLEISTTAVFSGNVRIKVHAVNEQDAAEFGQLRIMHKESALYADRTILAPVSSAPDFASRTLQAQVTSFSPFMIVREAPPLTLNPKAGFVTAGASPHAFYIGADQHVYELSASSAGVQKQDLTVLTGAAPADPGSGMAGLVDSMGYGRLFFVGVNQHILHMKLSPANVWSFSDLTAKFTSTNLAYSGSALAAFGTAGSNALHVFYLDANQHVNEFARTDGDTTGVWSNQDLSVLSGAAQSTQGSALAGLVDSLGDGRVFLVGANQHLLQLKLSPDNLWTFSDATAKVTNGPLASPNSALATFGTAGSNIVHLFYFDANQHVNDLARTDGEITGVWSNQDLTVLTGAMPPLQGSGLTGLVDSVANGRVFYVSSNQHVQQLKLTPANAWSVGDLMTQAGTTSTAVPVSALTTFGPAAGYDIHVLYLGVNQHVNDLLRTSSGSTGVWSNVDVP